MSSPTKNSEELFSDLAGAIIREARSCSEEDLSTRRIPANLGSLSSLAEFIRALPKTIPLPRPMVSSEKLLEIYWDLPGGYADINFEANGNITFFSRDKEKKERFEEITSGSVPDEEWFLDRLGSLAKKP